MPYVVTTKRPKTAADGYVPSVFVVFSRAVATLEEARMAVARIAQEGGHFNWSDPAYIDAKVPESGGTVGPLPDGTVIEVEPRQWYQLADDVEWDFHRDAHRGEAELLAAYNQLEVRARRLIGLGFSEVTIKGARQRAIVAAASPDEIPF